MNKKCLLLVIITIFNFFNLEAKEKKTTGDIVTSIKKIEIEGFPEAFNPSIIKTEDGFLLTFRHCLTPNHPSISYIGIVKLDNDLKVISSPRLLNTRSEYELTPSQAEDARIFGFNNKVYVIYNDNETIISPTVEQRRDMFIAQVQFVGDDFVLSRPLKLTHENKYATVNWQKNWVPFEWNGKLLMGYSINSHEVLEASLTTGISKTLFISSNKIKWKWGNLRGGTPAQLVDGNYLAFFHSSIVTRSEASYYQSMHHYYMGAYTFSANPPFNVLKTSKSPITKEGFYTQTACDKRVVFPGGYAIVDNKFYVAYGKDDTEIWIAVIDKTNLMKSLKKVINK
jgi:predicted GH43/DUF377 family glycosyl hydrolase